MKRYQKEQHIMIRALRGLYDLIVKTSWSSDQGLIV